MQTDTDPQPTETVGHDSLRQGIKPSPHEAAQRGFLPRIRAILRRLTRAESERESLQRLVMNEQNGIAAIGTDALSTDERALIGNVLKFKDRRAEDIMLPRADIVGIPVESTLEQIAEAFVESGYSRMPVYENTLDEVVGFIHVKDLTKGLISQAKDQAKDWTISADCREILVVAPSMYVSDLLVAMRTEKRHLAVVVDEYGGVDGLITIEDLMEEIVGDIEDEHDSVNGVEIHMRPNGDYLTRGRTRVETLEEHVGTILTEEEREEVDTVGGLVSHIGGKLPARGELVVHSSGTKFEVLEATPRKIISILVKPVQKSEHAPRPKSNAVSSGPAPADQSPSLGD